MRASELIVARARALVGVAFRAQGRDPARGVDCIGLASIAFGVPGVPSDYLLSGAMQGERLKTALKRDFRRITRPQRRPGDLLLLRAAFEQWHLAVLTEGGFVHADARRRMVVETPGVPAWPIAAVYRRRARKAR